MRRKPRIQKIAIVLGLMGLMGSLIQGTAAGLPPLYTLYGYVTDAVGRPLAGATVRDQSSTDITDAAGRYDLPESELGTRTVTVSRTGLVSRTENVAITLPVDTRHDFPNMLYRLSFTLSRTYVSTANASFSVTASVTSWAPNPGLPGTTDTSCVKLTDARTGTITDALWIGTNANGSQVWQATLTLPQATPEGIYSLSSRAEACDSGTVLSQQPSSSYVVDNSAPEITDISPRDGHNTIFDSQPLQAEVRDIGPSGIALNGITFKLTDESTPASEPVTFPANYSATSGIATSKTPALLIEGHDYTVSVTAVDRAGNSKGAGHLPYRGPLDPVSGGFRKVGMSATAATASIPPVSCPVSGDITRRVATCSDVAINFSTATVQVEDSRHSYDVAFLLHTASLESAEIKWEVAAGQTQTENAYQHRDPTGSEWDPKTVAFRYEIGDRTQLPSGFTATPTASSVGVGTLKVLLPTTWAAAGVVTFTMVAETSYTDGTGLPLTSACSDALSSPTPCATDPLWSRYTVMFDEGVQNSQVLLDEHRALGAEILYVYESSALPLHYEAIVPPGARPLIAGRSEVADLLPLRTENVEERYWYWVREIPTAAPVNEGTHLVWEHPATGVTQTVAVSPTDHSRLVHLNDFVPPEDPLEESLLTGITDVLEIRPLASLNPDTLDRATGNRRARYESATGSYWVEVQPMGDTGMRLVVAVLDGTAPADHEFELLLPEGTELLLGEGDSAVLIRSTQGGPDAPLGIFLPPVAYDANGREVPVRQTFEPNKVSLHLDLDGVAFPVVADPTFETIDCPDAATHYPTLFYLDDPDTGACPYGITFLWAFRHRTAPSDEQPAMYWPEKASVLYGGCSAVTSSNPSSVCNPRKGFRAVRLGGDVCSGVPSYGPWFDFRVPCRMHDYGYDLIRVKAPFEYPNVSKGDADFEFYVAMAEHCQSRPLVDRPFCADTAGRYYSGVSAVYWMPSDAKEWPKNCPSDDQGPNNDCWPDTQFLRNSAFFGGGAYWTLRYAPGGRITASIAYHQLSFRCDVVGECSLYQDSGQVKTFRGGENIRAAADAKCQSQLGCPYTLALWGRKPNGTWDWVGSSAGTFGTSWSKAELILTLPLNVEYTKLRWELYNDTTSRLIDIRHASLRLRAP